MQKKRGSSGKRRQKEVIIANIRQKFDISQELLAAFLGVSRSHLAMAERKERDLPLVADRLLLKIYVHFMELETGAQANYRSLETRLLLNDRYKTEIPKIKAREKECRLTITRLSGELLGMKRQEKDAENAIIVCTTFLGELGEKGETDAATGRQLEAFKLFKESAYRRLTGCWALAQVTLQLKIEALRAEARVLRRTRLMIMREQHPFKH